jgi:exosortase A-associated hydrolase 1
MSAYREETFLFDAVGAPLIGIVALPASDPERPVAAATLGVLIVVGGPQYRVGSHRQFVLLARSLAARGFAVMRFDCSGMGDSGGEPRDFTDRDADIRAAIDAFVAHQPTVDEIAIWGLCDAASAALLYAPQDPRVRHLVLLNPWVRSQAGLARTHLKHYYTRRFVDPAFWSQLVRGRVGVLRALGGLVATMRATRRTPPASDDDALDFRARMARGWKRFRGDVLLICSGDDLTAREFLDHAARDSEWRGVLDDARVSRCSVADADHTFSRAEWRDRVADETARWLTPRTSTSPSGRRRLEAAGRDDRTRVIA